MLRDVGQRPEAVLVMIVKRYVETAEPVGSRFVARRLGLSSATIRNVMADLEDIGLITQPYTSAGRIPTDKGYRYYIDSLMQVRKANENMIRAIKEHYGQALRSIEDVLGHTSHLISSLTNYVGITLFPQYDRVYFDGTSHIIEQPEFKDLKKLYTLMKCLEEKRAILNLLNNDIEDAHPAIHIGKESGFSYLNDCSIVTSGYKIKGKLSGRVGVLGPKRMIYEKVIPTVEALADAVTEMLGSLEV